jgi:uncharacterized membrane protein
MLYALFRHWHFNSGAYDLGIFDQAIWHLSRFERPESSIAGHTTIFSDHFHPIIVLLAPAYWLVPGPETLLVVQSLLLAASIIPVFCYAHSRIGRPAALWLSGSYGLFWAMQKAAAFDFHEVAFAPLAIATAILAVDRRQWRLLWLCIAALCLIKEDMIPLVGMFGIWLVRIGEVRQGIAALVVAVAAFAAVIGVVMPALGGEDSYPYWSSHLDAVRSGPISVVARLVTPPGKLVTLAMWLVPFALVPLRSPIILLAVPFMLGRLLSTSPNHWGMSFHYSAPLAPIIAMAAADGLARLLPSVEDRWRSTLMRTAPAVMLVLCAFLPGRLPLWRIFAPSHYRATTADRTGYEALALIPAERSVVAQHAVVPHVSERRHVYGLDPDAPDAEYVIATEHRTPWPNPSLESLRALLAARRARGYETMFERDGWTVLRRPARFPAAGESGGSNPRANPGVQ